MSYIGRNIDSINNISTLDNLSFNGSDATFNLTQNSVAFVPVSADALQIQIDGVIQSGNYTVSGSTVTFDFTPSGSSVCNGIKHFGVGLLTTVSDGAVTNVKLGADAVTTAKINDGAVTSGKIASGVIPTSRPNANPLMINGNMAVAQRSTSVSSANSSGYKAIDRYRHTISIGTWTISQSTDSPSDEGFGYSMKMDCTTAEASPSSASALAFVQKIEGQDLQLLKKGTSNAEKLTVAFWVKCTKTGTAQVNLVDEDNTRMIGQQFTVNATNTWEKKVLSFNADTSGALGNDNGSSLRLEIWLDAGSSYKSGTTPTSWESLNTADYFAGGTLNLGDNTSNDIYITGIQLEVGEYTSSTLPPFQHESYGDNLARCQRYYHKNDTTRWIGVYKRHDAESYFYYTMPRAMRTTPTVSSSDLGHFSNLQSSLGSALSNLGQFEYDEENGTIIVKVDSNYSGTHVFIPSWESQVIEFNSEL